MRVCLTAFGTPGDVLPALALAAGFQSRGHTVRFASTANFQAHALAAGVDFFLLHGDSQGFFSGGSGIAFREILRKPKSYLRFYQSYLAPFFRQNLLETWAAAAGFDAILSPSWMHATPSLAEKLRVPCYGVNVCPVAGIPTRDYPDPYTAPATPTSNLRSWHGSNLVTLAPLEDLNRWRVETLGLAPQTAREWLRSHRRAAYLLGYSPAFLPKPADIPAHTHVTGFWFPATPAGWQPPSELTHFLAHNPAPLLIGFSSQTPRNRAAFEQRLVEAVTAAGHPTILLAGWASLTPANLPPHILLQSSIPYDWILPRVSAFVHHGGSGSTGAALRHGLPSMAMPFGADQLLWAQRLAQQGCGPAPLNPERFIAEDLTRSLLDLVHSPIYRENARRFAALIEREDGIATAIAQVERDHAGGTLCASS